MKSFDRKGLDVRNLGFWKKFGRVWLLLEVYGMKIMLGICIGWENCVMIGFCNGQKSEEPPKSCLEIVSHFGQSDTISIAGSNSNLLIKNFGKKFLVQNFVSRFSWQSCTHF